MLRNSNIVWNFVILYYFIIAKITFHFFSFLESNKSALNFPFVLKKRTFSTIRTYFLIKCKAFLFCPSKAIFFFVHICTHLFFFHLSNYPTKNTGGRKVGKHHRPTCQPIQQDFSNICLIELHILACSYATNK